jgi:hypothetical protein
MRVVERGEYQAGSNSLSTGNHGQTLTRDTPVGLGATNALKQRLDVLLVHAAGAIDRIDARHSSST